VRCRLLVAGAASRSDQSKSITRSRCILWLGARASSFTRPAAFLSRHWLSSMVLDPTETRKSPSSQTRISSSLPLPLVCRGSCSTRAARRACVVSFVTRPSGDGGASLSPPFRLPFTSSGACVVGDLKGRRRSPNGAQRARPRGGRGVGVEGCQNRHRSKPHRLPSLPGIVRRPYSVT
jgi:hypothetical protein